MPPFIRWGRLGAQGWRYSVRHHGTLQLLGFPTVLNVVGCSPPNATAFTNPGLLIRPFLDMGQEADRKCLYELFSTADFFILPSRAECAAIAFCDANAFGLPVFTTDVGGISSFVRHGVNGYMLSASASGETSRRRLRLFSMTPCAISACGSRAVRSTKHGLIGTRGHRDCSPRLWKRDP